MSKIHVHHFADRLADLRVRSLDSTPCDSGSLRSGVIMQYFISATRRGGMFLVNLTTSSAEGTGCWFIKSINCCFSCKYSLDPVNRDLGLDMSRAHFFRKMPFFLNVAVEISADHTLCSTSG